MAENAANGVAVEHADQPGARVYLEGFSTEPPLQTALLADGLTNARVELHERECLDAASRSSCPGELAEREAASWRCSGARALRTRALSRSGDVQNGGRMLVEDTWFEGVLRGLSV